MIFEFFYSLVRHFLPNPGRILPALTYDGYNPLDVNDALKEK